MSFPVGVHVWDAARSDRLHGATPPTPGLLRRGAITVLKIERSEGLMASITEHEERQVKRANASGRKPVVFVHGLWLLPSSWDRWTAVFKKAGYTTLTPGWPDDPETVE